jgi:hypothetical protein
MVTAGSFSEESGPGMVSCTLDKGGPRWDSSVHLGQSSRVAVVISEENTSHAEYYNRHGSTGVLLGGGF